MLTAHRIALDPTAAQAAYFRRACGVARFAYNWALAEWKRQQLAGLKPNANKVKAAWNAIRHLEYPWSGEVTKCASNQAIRDLGAAFTNFFRDLQKPVAQRRFRYPTRKRKNHCRDSFALWNDQFKVVDNKVKIPGLPKSINLVRLRESLRFHGKLISATVSRTADRWFISIQVEVADTAPRQQPQESVGIDLGLKHLAVLSHPLTDGTTVFANPRPLRAATVKLRRLQRGCSRQEQGRKRNSMEKSKRAVKRQRQLARVHARVANVRSDALHKMTTKIVSEFKVVVLEDLNNASMLRNRCLARSLSDAAFGELRRHLEYKTARSGGYVRVINRFERSTGVCPDCGYKTESRLALNIRSWTCPDCGAHWDRDVAAARVIHKVGTACPEPVVASPQPTHGETSALAVVKAATKLTSANRELSCVNLHRIESRGRIVV